MKRSRIIASSIVISILISAPVISGLWMSGYLSPKKTEKRPPPFISYDWLKVLDIVGDMNNSSGSNIEYITFIVTVWAGKPGFNITHLRMHWLGPTKSVHLTLAPASWTNANATNFAAEEIPVKSPRTPDWNPPNTFVLQFENIIYIKINLTSLNGINDTLGPRTNVRVYFEVTGFVLEQTFTTPNSFGTNRYIDLTVP